MKQASDTKLTPKSLSCLNHLKHGSTSKTLFLKDENPEEFFALLENFFLQHQPNFRPRRCSGHPRRPRYVDYAPPRAHRRRLRKGSPHSQARPHLLGPTRPPRNASLRSLQNRSLPRLRSQPQKSPNHPENGPRRTTFAATVRTRKTKVSHGSSSLAANATPKRSGRNRRILHRRESR
jgi:hypothetical protein